MAAPAHCDFLAGVCAGNSASSCFPIPSAFNQSICTNFCLSGAFNMFISHPLDTVKTNMQSENIRFFQAARLLFKTEGVCIAQL